MSQLVLHHKAAIPLPQKTWVPTWVTPRLTSPVNRKNKTLEISMISRVFALLRGRDLNHMTSGL